MIIKKGLLFLIFILLITKQGFAQLIYQPYSYQFYQKLNDAEYSPDSRLHTSLKPYFLTDSTPVRHLYDSLLMLNVDNTKKSWANRILFSGHGVDVKRKGYTFYIDYLPDQYVGKDLVSKETTWLNTRGFQFGATIGDEIFLYTSTYENQGKFPNYITSFIKQTKDIPGQGIVNGVSFGVGNIDWAYSTSLIGYTPNKNITLALGMDKIFIGDGYRSLLLSDNAPVYPLLRFTVNLTKNIQYTAIWAYLEDFNAPNFNSFSNYRRKWAAFHYLDWNITNRASFGFFNAIIDEEADNQGNLHGFDVNYINPVFFSSSLGPSGAVPDHTLLGFTGKYKVLDKTTVYGQLVFDQSATNSNNSNVSAWQFGVRGSDLFKVKNLNYIFEYNSVAPNTYYGKNAIVNYTQGTDPLTDPFGSNFKEILGILNYSMGRFDLQLEGNYTKLGPNTGGSNYGADITTQGFVNITPLIGYLEQTVPTTVTYAEGTIAFVLNPKYNLRIELGGLFRDEKSSQSNVKNEVVTIGLRSSFRNIYHDF